MLSTDATVRVFVNSYPLNILSRTIKVERRFAFSKEAIAPTRFIIRTSSKEPP